MKLTITVTDDTSSASAQTSQVISGALAGGAAQTGTDGSVRVFDGGAMPELLQAMAEEVQAGRMPPPGPVR